jgi:hypothetical protein
MTSPTTLGAYGEARLPQSLRSYIDGLVEISRRPQRNPIAERHVLALEQFGQFVQSLDLDDQRLVALTRIWTSLGGTPPIFDPPAGTASAKLLNQLGAINAQPSNEVTLNELVAAGVHDLARIAAQDRRDIDNRRAAAEGEADTLRPDAERMAGLEIELSESKEREQYLTDQNGRLQREVDHWRDVAIARQAPASARPPAPAAPAGPAATDPPPPLAYRRDVSTPATAVHDPVGKHPGRFELPADRVPDGAAEEDEADLEDAAEIEPYLDEVYDQGADAESEGTKDRRRVAVEGARGVYVARPDAPGPTTYEIGYREGGRQVWEMVGPDLEEAIARRTAIVAATEQPTPQHAS